MTLKINKFATNNARRARVLAIGWISGWISGANRLQNDCSMMFREHIDSREKVFFDFLPCDGELDY